MRSEVVLKIRNIAVIIVLSLSQFTGCVPEITKVAPMLDVPKEYVGDQTKECSAKVNWREFFKDPDLVHLIDTALAGNQELKIFLQELEVIKNEASARGGAYLPFVELGAGAGFDKVGRYTRNGALEANNEISPGNEFPEPLGNYRAGARASWEIDIWSRLRNAEKAAISRVLATEEGRNFLVTNLVAEVARAFYELRALDDQMAIVKQNIETQSNALEMVKVQKEAARVTELALRRFEALVLKTRSLQFETQQKIIETENRINFLVGRFPQRIARGNHHLNTSSPTVVASGVPSDLLRNRPDIRQAELTISAAELDVQVARAAFYPSLTLTADIGYEAYRIGSTIRDPESLFYSLVGGLAGPLLNRRAITAEYYSANARQIAAVFSYERTVLGAFIEACNQISNVQNLTNSIELREQEVKALSDSVEIAGMLFSAARAEYTEVLLTQRDALESRFELINTKKEKLIALVNLYRALGGGWERGEAHIGTASVAPETAPTIMPLSSEVSEPTPEVPQT